MQHDDANWDLLDAILVSSAFPSGHYQISTSLFFELEKSKQTPNFNYGIVDAETQIVAQQHTNEVETLMRRTSQDVIAIGQKLIEVKQHLGQVNWSISTINKFMQIGEQFKFVNFTNLNITASALHLIAAPSTHKEARAEFLVVLQKLKRW